MTRTILALPLLLSAVAFSAPAAAAPDARCTDLPQAIRAALPTAEPKAAQMAQRRLTNGEQLCRANGERAAAKEFRAAAKHLGLDLEAKGGSNMAAAGSN